MPFARRFHTHTHTCRYALRDATLWYATLRYITLAYIIITTSHSRSSTSELGLLNWLGSYYLLLWPFHSVPKSDARSETIVISGLQARSCEDEGLQPSLRTWLESNCHKKSALGPFYIPSGCLLHFVSFCIILYFYIIVFPMQVEMRSALQFLQEASLDVSKWEVESRAALGLEHAQKSCLVEAWDHMNTHTSLHHIYVYYTYDIPTVYIRIYIYTWHQLSTVKRIYIYII